MIYVVDAHAPWPPHNNSRLWPKGSRLSEYSVSHAINLDVARRVDVKHIGMSEVYHCTQPCGMVACCSYAAGLRRLTQDTIDGVLAIQTHVDVAPATMSGPICLYTGDEDTRAFCLELLSHIEKLSGKTRRGRTQYNGVRWDGAFCVDDLVVSRAYGYKCFLAEGCKRAVILEIGNILNKSDVDWIVSGDAVKQCSTAIVYAIRSFAAKGLI